MPWHRSKTNPCKVYNSRHEPLCICQTPEEAERVIAEAILLGEEIGREPASSERIQEPVNPSPTDFFEHDECCGPRLTRALRAGIVADSWVCPKCGAGWLATLDTASGIRQWKPEVTIAVWR